MCLLFNFFLLLFFSSILWTKYGILTGDIPVCTVGILGIIAQSLYLVFYYLNTRDRDKVSSFMLRQSFCFRELYCCHGNGYDVMMS